jgi:hypothetical protein
LSLRISLLAHSSPTGTNQTLLRVKNKLMLIKRTEIPQIILVLTDSRSSNYSTTSSRPPEKLEQFLMVETRVYELWELTSHSLPPDPTYLGPYADTKPLSRPT